MAYLRCTGDSPHMIETDWKMNLPFIIACHMRYTNLNQLQNPKESIKKHSQGKADLFLFRKNQFFLNQHAVILIDFFSRRKWNKKEIRRDFLSLHWLLYTLFQRKRNFNLPIFPGAPGSLTLTYGHDVWPKYKDVHFVSLNLSSPTEQQFKKVTFLLEKRVQCRFDIAFAISYLILLDC